MLQDEDYRKAGAKVVPGSDALGQDIVMKVRPPSDKEVDCLKEGAKWVAAAAVHRLTLPHHSCCLSKESCMMQARMGVCAAGS